MTATSAWICTVCGYVHQGPEPPAQCPVCGVTRERFQPRVDAAPPTRSTGTWVCTVCGYVHEGAEPPAVCPVCAADRTCFEARDAAVTDAGPATSAADHLVIVGAGIAGVSAAAAARRACPEARVTLLSRETEMPYYRLNLTRYLGGEVPAEQLDLHPEAWYSERGIDLRRGVEVCDVDAAARRLRLREGGDLAYDRLVLAVGAHPFVPPLPGVRREHVTTLRTRADADALLAQAEPGCRAVVIGGGLLGLETAGALARRGLQVSLHEGHDWLLPRQLDAAAAAVLARQVTAQGITLRPGARTRDLVGDERVRGVTGADGTTEPADLVVIATGVRPNSYLARLAGLDVDRGVVVDPHLRTSCPEILAAGDVAQHHGVLYGTWGPAQIQGTVAGGNVETPRTVFGGLPRANLLKVLGIGLFSIGRIAPTDGSDLVMAEAGEGTYRLFLFHDSHLEGAILLGDTRCAAAVKTLIEQRGDCSRLLATRPGVDDVLAFLDDGP